MEKLELKQLVTAFGELITAAARLDSDFFVSESNGNKFIIRKIK